MARFTARATPDEARQFAAWVAAGDEASRTRALEMVLFKLDDHELFHIGVTQVHQPGHVDWAVAWSRDRGDAAKAVADALRRAQVPCCASCDLGRAGWYVEREQFFLARAALLESAAVRSLGIEVVNPKFDL
jgi:hypothetical protein